MIRAVIICALLITVAVIAIIAIEMQQRDQRRPHRAPHKPRHACASKHSHRRVVIEDPRDQADPDGAQYAAQLRGQQQPRSYVPPPVALLEQVRDALLELPAAPPEEATTTPAADETGPIPHAVGTWGRTAAELADQLAAQHLGAHA